MLATAEIQTRLRRYLVECRRQRKIRSGSWRRDGNNYATINGQRNYHAHWLPQISTEPLAETLRYAIRNHTRLHTCIYEGVKVLRSHGTREEKQRTAFKRQVEDRARRVRRDANWMRRDSRTEKFLRGGSREIARNSRPDRRTIPARLVRVLARRVGQEG